MNKHDEKTKRKKKNTTAVLRLNSSHLIPEFLRQKQFLLTKKSILAGISMFFFFLLSKRSLSRNIRRQMYVPTKISRSLKMRITALQRLSKRQIELGTEIQ